MDAAKGFDENMQELCEVTKSVVIVVTLVIMVTTMNVKIMKKFRIFRPMSDVRPFVTHFYRTQVSLVRSMGLVVSN